MDCLLTVKILILIMAQKGEYLRKKKEEDYLDTLIYMRLSKVDKQNL